MQRRWRLAVPALQHSAHRVAGPCSAFLRSFSESVAPMWESEEGASRAQIVEVSQEAPSVKRFRLAPQDPAAFAFTPGQWVDLFAPGVPQVGGYSIISTPLDLRHSGVFELAVKRSAHPPAAWLNDKARPGDWVQVRPGGSFRYQAGDEARPLLLVAGGIGITPLHSILRHCWQLAYSRDTAAAAAAAATAAAAAAAPPSSSLGRPLAQQQQQQQQQEEEEEEEEEEEAGPGQAPSLRATLLYSSSAPQEFALLQDLRQLEQGLAGGVRLQLWVTGAEWRGREVGWGGRWGRLAAEDIRAAVEELLCAHEGGGVCGAQQQEQQQQQQQWPRRRALSDVLAFVCGPPGMLDAVLGHLAGAGLAAEQVRYEKWW